VRTLSLTIDQLYDRPHHHPWLGRLMLADLVRGCARVLEDHRAGLDVTARSGDLRTRIAAEVGIVAENSDDPNDVLDSVSLLGRVDQLRSDAGGRHPADPRDEPDLDHPDLDDPDLEAPDPDVPEGSAPGEAR
jgi:hypothetical protein